MAGEAATSAPARLLRPVDFRRDHVRGGAACLCGVGDTMALPMADEAFGHGPLNGAAKIGGLAGSALAAILGVLVFLIPAPKAAIKTAQPAPAAGASPGPSA